MKKENSGKEVEVLDAEANAEMDKITAEWEKIAQGKKGA